MTTTAHVTLHVGDPDLTLEAPEGVWVLADLPQPTNDAGWLVNVTPDGDLTGRWRHPTVTPERTLNVADQRLAEHGWRRVGGWVDTADGYTAPVEPLNATDKIV